METATVETNLIETAVALPAGLFQRGEDLARRWGISRDELYRRALSHILARAEETELTRQLNEVYDSINSSPAPEGW
jgi:hypothetical protein